MASSIPGNPETTPAPPRRAPVGFWMVLTVLAALICLACAAFIAFMAVGALNDPYTDPGDYTYRWSMTGLVACVPAAIASLCCFLYLVTRSVGVLRVTQVCLFISFAGMVALTVVGFGLLEDTDQKGGDWEALNVLVVYAFCIAPPVIVCVLDAFLVFSSSLLRRRFVT